MQEIELHSQRILLRDIKEADAEYIFRYRCLDQIAKYQYWNPFTWEQAVSFVDKCKNPNIDKQGEWIGLAVIYKKTNELIGDCALKLEKGAAEIGCNISPLYQQQGMAKEVLSLLLNFCFNKPAINQVYGITDSENIASVRLMQSLGMTKSLNFEEKALCKNNWCTEHKYLIHKFVWEKYKHKV